MVKIMKNILTIMMFSISYLVNSQYCNTATTNDAITPSTTIQYSSTYSSGRRAFNFNAVAGNEYTFSTVGQTSVDTYLRLYSTGSGGSLLMESDDYFNTQSEITWYCTVSGTYSVLLTRWTTTSSCSNLNANARIKYQMGNTAGSTIVTIGNGEGSVYQVPVNHYYKYGWSEMIYLQSEINTVGSITKIRFQTDPGSPSSYVAENQKIYMGHTTYSSLPNVVVKENAQTNYVSGNYTLVYDGTITWGIGWTEITLQTPFSWNNTDNLLIKYENREGTFSASYPMFYYTTKTGTVGYNYQDASYPTSDGIRDGFRPNIKIAIADVTALPITLSLFDGVNNGRDNILFWKTESEINSSHFNIMKSIDGEIWDLVGTINANTNSTHTIEYNLTDYNVKKTINYYMLAQYDLDGVYYYYGPISINNQEDTKVIIKFLNMLGQEITYEEAISIGVYLEVYSDGTTNKVFSE